MTRSGSVSRLAVCAAGLAGALLATAVLARTPLPKNDGWVTDQAGFLSSQQEQVLETLMES
ncbi:MAG: hypothetical protein ACE5ID_00190, partial [Acidobacteriota bacterium]